MKEYLGKADDVLGELSREFIILTGFVAVIGSLATSEIFGWQTFTLSTIQRLFMYPIPLITGSAVVLDWKDLRKLVLPLSTLGMLTSAFHFLTVLFDPTRGCGFALPCSAGFRYTVAGFSLRPMYLPLLAFIAFAMITLLVWRYEAKSVEH